MVTRLTFLFAAALVLAASQDRDKDSAHTVPGPEATDLVSKARGVILMTHPVGGIDSVRLPGLEPESPRKGDAGLLPVHSVAGPDSSGRIAFVENDMVNKKHALRTLAADGKVETVFEASGDALWDHAVGEHLALDSHGALIALVARAKGVQNNKPDALLMEGELEIWSTEKHQRVATPVAAMDDTICWLPDGKRLIYTAFVPKAEAEKLLRVHVHGDDPFGRSTAGWTRVPVVHEFVVETSTSRPLHVGERPIVSPDGKLVLLRDFDLHWRVLDIASNESKAFEAVGAIYPGAIAFVDSNTVLFWAWPTDGAAAKFTKNNSPLVGPKQMRSLKLVDLRDGRFETAVPFIDPRRAVSFGPGESKSR
jgi:hypothetical protein